MKKKKIIVIIISIILLFLILDFWNEMSRKYYCLTEDKCITVWKRSDGYCYIIPGKYTSWFKPKDNYIKADNLGSLDIIWKSNNEIIGYIDNSSKIINKNKNQVRILNYKDSKKTYDSIYTYHDGYYLRYKKSVNYISIDVKESYARTSDGRILK